jgi:hypothetical protein
VVSFPQVSLPKPVYTSSLPHTCYMPRTSHSSRFDHPNNVWWKAYIKVLNTKYNLGLNTELFRIFVFCNPLEFRDTTLNYRTICCRDDFVDLLYRRYLVRISPNTGCCNRLFRGFPQCHGSRPTCISSQTLPSKSFPFHHLWWNREISYSPDGCSTLHRNVGRFPPD